MFFILMTIVNKIMRVLSVCMCANESSKMAEHAAMPDILKVHTVAWVAWFHLEVCGFLKSVKKNEVELCGFKKNVKTTQLCWQPTPSARMLADQWAACWQPTCRATMLADQRAACWQATCRAAMLADQRAACWQLACSARTPADQRGAC